MTVLLSSLPDGLSRCWEELTAGVRSAKHGFHLMTVASVADGEPQARTVVLRAVDPSRWEVRFHTDRRSTKCSELRRAPAVALTWYDPRRRLQLRGRGVARIIDQGTEHDLLWAQIPLMSRRIYLVTAPPGTPVSAPSTALPPAVHDRDPTPLESEAGKEHFAAAVITLSEIEALELHATGHLRARWRRVGTTAEGEWLIP